MPLFGILIKFREHYYVGFIGDIKQMFNSVAISELDQHCHRFLWRNMETFRKPDVFVITAVNLGDRPSGTIATVALYRTAEFAETSHPMEAEIVKESSYVDDIISSVETTEIAERVTNNITQILKVGNFHIKGWVISGHPLEKSSNTNLEKSETERVLGTYWEPYTDCFRYKVNLNKYRTVPNQVYGRRIKYLHR